MSKETAAAPKEPTHLVVLDDADGYRKGQVVENSPAVAKALGDNARPASAFDLGVAAVTRKD